MSPADALGFQPLAATPWQAEVRNDFKWRDKGRLVSAQQAGRLGKNTTSHRVEFAPSTKAPKCTCSLDFSDEFGYCEWCGRQR